MTFHAPPDPVRRHTIPAGVAGVRATLKLMTNLVRQGRKDPTVIAAAERITLRVPPQQYTLEIDTLFKWVKAHIRYLRDPRDVEKISTPERTLRVGTGDCDDMAVLLASLLESVGNKTRFVAMGMDGDTYSHVITQVRLGGGAWISLDPTVTYATLGWSPPNQTRRMVAHI